MESRFGAIRHHALGLHQVGGILLVSTFQTQLWTTYCCGYVRFTCCTTYAAGNFISRLYHHTYVLLSFLTVSRVNRTLPTHRLSLKHDTKSTCVLALSSEAKSRLNVPRAESLPLAPLVSRVGGGAMNEASPLTISSSDFQFSLEPKNTRLPPVNDVANQTKNLNKTHTHLYKTAEGVLVALSALLTLSTI